MGGLRRALGRVVATVGLMVAGMVAVEVLAGKVADVASSPQAAIKPATITIINSRMLVSVKPPGLPLIVY